MSATDQAPVVQRRIVSELGAERIERDIPDLGMLVFENAEAGQWLTKKGAPAKKAKRLYTLNDRELVSVTTVQNVLAKPALIAWAEDHGARGAIEASRLGEIPDDLPLDEVIGRVRTLGLGAEAVKRRAAKRGLDLHDALETWAQSGDLPDPAMMDPEHRPYLRGLARALLELDPEPIAAEQITCSPALGYAGRYDLRAIVDGQVTMLDLKTSASGKPYPEAHTQLQAYALADEAIGVPRPERLIALGVSPEGAFCADDCCATPEHWLAVLGCFRAMVAIRDGMKAAA
jgi:hypothetical protein